MSIVRMHYKLCINNPITVSAGTEIYVKIPLLWSVSMIVVSVLCECLFCFDKLSVISAQHNSLLSLMAYVHFIHKCVSICYVYQDI